MYINLHSHFESSPMDGFSNTDEYITRCKEVGVDFLAVTDHGTTHMHRELQRAAKAADINPILGLEAYFSPTDRFDRRAKKNREEADSIYHHLILLAKNDNGLNNLYAGNRIAWNEGFYLKNRWDMDLIEQYGEDLIVLSGCMNSPIASAFNRGDDETAYKWAQRFKEVLGDNFYIETQTDNHKINPIVNPKLLQLADDLSIRAVVTDDCHRASPEDKIMQEVFLILSTNPKKGANIDLAKAQKMDLMERFDYLYPERKMTFKDFDLYLHAYEEKREKSKIAGLDREDLFENTVKIANDIEGYSYVEGAETLPNISDSPDKTLREKVYAGLKAKGLDKKPEYIERAERELGVIIDKRFPNYFLVLEDAVSWANKQGIRSNAGRGSAAGSLVCYSMDLTGLDPIEHNLLFERFLDPERSDWPDLDWDSQHDRRNEIKQYMIDKYGYAANITTVNRYKGKQALKSAGRALGIPFATMNKAMKCLTGISEVTGHDVIKEFRLRNKQFNAQYPDVARIAEKLFGRITGYGMHAAGLIVANKPISNYASMETRKSPDADERVEVVGVDYRECEKIGLIKIDLLGLKTLTVVEDCIRLIHENQGIMVDIDGIKLDGHDGVFKMLSEGKTRGIFQAEESASTKLIMDMGIDSFNDLVVSNALVRPGAMDAIGKEYLKSRQTGRWNKIHPDVDSFMDETYGLPLYQEQLMQLSVSLAGFTVGEANKLRKGLGKKLPEIIESYRPKFIDGASEKIDKATAEKLWKSFEAAGSYMFNKSHAVAYSLLTLKTAWLKYHYPLEYMCALLRNEKDNGVITDYLLECKAMGIKIKFPHINYSEDRFVIENDSLRMGLSNVKFLSDKLAGRIIAARPFDSYAQFKEHVLSKGSGLNTRVLQALNAFGGAAFEDNPRPEDYRKNLYEYLGIPAFETSVLTHGMKSQIRSLEDFVDDETFIIMAMIKDVKQKDNWKRIDVVDSSGTAGIFVNPESDIVKGKMYLMLIGNNSVLRYLDMDELSDKSEDALVDFLRRPKLEEVPDGQFLIIGAAARKTKAGKNMASLAIADNTKQLKTILVFDSMFNKAKLMAKIGVTRVITIGKMKDGTEFLRDIY